MRILCISDEYPWPPTHGYRLRLENVVRGLAEAGTVDLFCTVAERPDLPAGEQVSPPAPLARLFVHHRCTARPDLSGLVAWLTKPWPRAVAWIDWRSAQAALADWAAPSYDVVWFSRCLTWLPLGGIDRGPVVVDLDNLEDEKLRLMMRLWRLERREQLGAQPLRRRIRRWLGAALDRRDVGRWTRAQLRAAAEARAVVVCSDLDRERLGRPAAVVPNGYELANMGRERVETSDPVLTMVGLLIYPPNADAASYFAHLVLPLVRKEIPSARFRLVGRAGDSLEPLVSLPGVELLGEVADLDEIFASTTAVVVPLRAGSGTRVKVLEAFARRLPVVSTGLGCEGLGAVHGEHLLVAEGAESLATACIRILSDPVLARSLGEAGHDLWQSRYRADHARRAVAELAEEVGAR